MKRRGFDSLWLHRTRRQCNASPVQAVSFRVRCPQVRILPLPPFIFCPHAWYAPQACEVWVGSSILPGGSTHTHSHTHIQTHTHTHIYTACWCNGNMARCLRRRCGFESCTSRQTFATTHGCARRLQISGGQFDSGWWLHTHDGMTRAVYAASLRLRCSQVRILLPSLFFVCYHAWLRPRSDTSG